MPYQEYHNRRKVRMHVLREQRRRQQQQLLQKQVSTDSADTSLTTSLLDNSSESDIVRFFV